MIGVMGVARLPLLALSFSGKVTSFFKKDTFSSKTKTSKVLLQRCLSEKHGAFLSYMGLDVLRHDPRIRGECAVGFFTISLSVPKVLVKVCYVSCFPSLGKRHLSGEVYEGELTICLLR